ncbi:hypothetical protein SOVF_092130 [Spinacia oleracea]|nr:hypothetical protein SOVF_092130 [Spinacia oleracea]
MESTQPDSYKKSQKHTSKATPQSIQAAKITTPPIKPIQLAGEPVITPVENQPNPHPGSQSVVSKTQTAVSNKDNETPLQFLGYTMEDDDFEAEPESPTRNLTQMSSELTSQFSEEQLATAQAVMTALSSLKLGRKTNTKPTTTMMPVYY